MPIWIENESYQFYWVNVKKIKSNKHIQTHTQKIPSQWKECKRGAAFQNVIQIKSQHLIGIAAI